MWHSAPYEMRCMRTYGLGPRHVSHAMGKSERSHPSCSSSRSRRFAMLAAARPRACAPRACSLSQGLSATRLARLRPPPDSQSDRHGQPRPCSARHRAESGAQQGPGRPRRPELKATAPRAEVTGDDMCSLSSPIFFQDVWSTLCASFLYASCGGLLVYNNIRLRRRRRRSRPGSIAASPTHKVQLLPMTLPRNH